MAFYFYFNKAIAETEQGVKDYKFQYSKVKVASIASVQSEHIFDIVSALKQEQQKKKEELIDAWVPSHGTEVLDKIEQSTNTNLAIVTIRGQKFIADSLLNTLEYHTGICLHKYGKVWYLLKNFCPFPAKPGQDPHPPVEDPDFVGWEVEFRTTPKSGATKYSSFEGINIDDITDETANGGDDWDGSNRTVVLYFVGYVNEAGEEVRLEEPYLMDWSDPASEQNQDMQEFLQLNGFNPYYNAPGACYNIDTDSQTIVTATYALPLIFKLACVETPVNNVSVEV